MSPLADLLAPLSLPQVLGLMAAAVAGGLVRGFTGFGFAMVFVPLATTVVSPAAAVGLVWAIDAPFAAPLALPMMRRAEWSQVLPLLAGSTLLLPIGVLLLTRLDPVATRWIIALMILAAVAALASGWRYRRRPSLVLSGAVGGLSGLTSGLASLGGMPLAIFWLGSQRSTALQTRANLLTYFALSTVTSGTALFLAGVLTLDVVRQAVVLLAPYGLGIAIGTRAFGRASDAAFRRAAHVVIAASALLALPLFDPWLR